jgi:signal peptidase II
VNQILRKARVFWPLVLLLVLSDCATKRWASTRLVEHVPHPVIGDVVQFTLTHNTGAATGISLGEYSRVGFSVLTLGALVLLFGLYRAAHADDVRTATAVAAITGGAIGNLVDRVRWERGVVDFIDVGLGDNRFWVFNVADIAVTCGAVALAWLLWKHDAELSGARTPGDA